MVSQVVELAREWVELEGRKTPGFHGAYLLGSILDMPENASFATYRDVDLGIVVPDGSGHDSGRKNDELLYRGLILEISYHELERFRSLEAVLSDPEYTSCFAVDCILSDPTDILRDLHTVVARDCARRKWVLARCDYEKARFMDHLRAMRQPASPTAAGFHLGYGLCYLAGLVAVADLRVPTHRRCLILMRELLEPRGESALCEEALDILGCRHMNRAQIESYLQEGAEIFDRAVEVKRSPSPTGHKLHAFGRPYFVQAAKEMIDEGYHREAMWWICGCYNLSNAAIQNDAPEEEKPQFQASLDCLLDDMGLSTPEDWAVRAEQARALAEEVFQVADEIVAQNPEIVD